MLIPTQYHNTLTPVSEILPILLNLIARENILEVEVSTLHQRRFTGDFFGLLKQKNIDSKYWMLILMLNRYSHPGEYSGDAKFKNINGLVVDQAVSAASVRRRSQFK